jgi:hypothetical protein
MSDPNEFRDFSRYLAGRLKTKGDDDTQRSQKAIQDMAILKRGFNALWDDACKSLEELRKTVNSNPEIGIHLISSPESKSVEIARSDVPEKLRMTGDPDALTITFQVLDASQCGQYTKTYCPKLTVAQTDSYFVDEQGNATTIQQMCMRATADQRRRCGSRSRSPKRCFITVKR